jgi:hypothetical protein
VAHQVRDSAAWCATSSVSLGRQLLQACGVGAAPHAGGLDGRRSLPGFWRQFYLVLSRAVLMRTREPLAVLTGGGGGGRGTGGRGAGGGAGWHA